MSIFTICHPIWYCYASSHDVGGLWMSATLYYILCTMIRWVSTNCNQFLSGFQMFSDWGNWQPNQHPNWATTTKGPVALVGFSLVAVIFLVQSTRPSNTNCHCHSSALPTCHCHPCCWSFAVWHGIQVSLARNSTHCDPVSICSQWQNGTGGVQRGIGVVSSGGGWVTSQQVRTWKEEKKSVSRRCKKRW